MGGCGSYSNMGGCGSYSNMRGGRPSVSTGQDRQKCSVTCGYGPRAGRVCSGACSLNITEGMCCNQAYGEAPTRDSRNFMGSGYSNFNQQGFGGYNDQMWFN